MSWHSGPPQHPGASGESEHVCPLAPVTDDEAALALVEVTRTAQNAEQIVNRLRLRGLVIGRVRT